MSCRDEIAAFTHNAADQADMNPKDFVGMSPPQARYVSPESKVVLMQIAPWDAFELANYAKDNKSDKLVVPSVLLSPYLPLFFRAATDI